MNEDPLGPARGILFALAFVAPFWIAVFLIIWGLS